MYIMKSRRIRTSCHSKAGMVENRVQQRNAAVSASDCGTRKGRVLILDSDPVVRDTVTYMLRMLGYASYAAETEEEAAECYHRASACGYPFRAVIWDLHALQASAGEETTKHLPLDDRQIGAIAMSSADSYMTAKECWRRGVRVALWKPFTLNELEQALALCADRTGVRAS